VYRYFYQGHRRTRAAAEHVFQVSTGGRDYVPVSVFLPEPVIQAFERAHGRALTATERYAAIKLALFQAFDERPGPEALGLAVRVSPEDLESFAVRLGLF
jgi:hypothetical protein